MLTSKSYLFFYISLELGVGLVIGVYEFLALATSKRGLLAQTNGRYPIDNPKVDRFGVATLLFGDLFYGY